ncbi:MAG: xanthine permease, partial [Desulfobacca sp.]|nr:xanthine permease [Desulfobacca sp.]
SLGSGFLAIQVANPIFLPLSIHAVRIGGMGLLSAMLVATGVFQATFSRFFSRLRAVFPPELSGVIITMLGLSMVPISIKRFFGYDGVTGAVVPAEILVATVTLATITGLTIASKKRIRLFAVIIGIAVGFGASWVTGTMDPTFMTRLQQAPILSYSFLALPKYNLDLALLIPFLITGLISTIDTAGGIITCQKMMQESWTRPNPRTLSRGVFADGVGNILAGAAGGFGVGVATANVGLALATGAASRVIAQVVGCVFIALAFLPKVSLALSMIPTPVMGAVLVFAVSFIIVSGIELIMVRMMDDRRRAMVGLSLVAGMSIEVLPGLYSGLEFWQKGYPLSSVAVASITALILNLIFRLGTSQKARLDLPSGEVMQQRIHDFMKEQGSRWGAREDVVFRAIQALVECVELVGPTLPPEGMVKVEVSFDEFNLDLSVRFPGTAPVLPGERPSLDTIADSQEGFERFQGYLLRQYADRLNVVQEENQAIIKIHFDN